MGLLFGGTVNVFDVGSSRNLGMAAGKLVEWGAFRRDFDTISIDIEGTECSGLFKRERFAYRSMRLYEGMTKLIVIKMTILSG